MGKSRFLLRCGAGALFLLTLSVLTWCLFADTVWHSTVSILAKRMGPGLWLITIGLAAVTVVVVWAYYRDVDIRADSWRIMLVVLVCALATIPISVASELLAIGRSNRPWVALSMIVFVVLGLAAKALVVYLWWRFIAGPLARYVITPVFRDLNATEIPKPTE